jgi:hypothetical protein
MDLTVIDAGDRPSRSYARNAGAAASAAGRLLFVDADDEVAPDYVEEMARALDDHAFVTSRVDSETLNPPWVRAAHGAPWQALSIGVFLEFLPGAGANIGIGRELFLDLGGFSEEFSGAEDLAFSWTVQLEADVSIPFVLDAVYRYRYRDSFWGLFRQSLNWGREHVLLYRRFRARGLKKRSAAMALGEWRAVLAGLVTVPAASQPEIVVRLGYCLGRLAGSLRYRVWYL